jgi:hypothetical protein
MDFTVPRAKLRQRGILFCLLACYLLNGCARPTEVQQTAIRAGTAIKEARAESNACLAATREKPKYATIISRYPNLETNQYSIEQLTDKNIPTSEEAQLVASLYDDAGACRNIFDKSIAENRPDIVNILGEVRNKTAQITISLVQRKISWGEAAEEFQALKSESDAKTATANRQWTSDLQASNDAEMAQRRAAAAVAIQYLQNQQMINQQQSAIQQQNLNQQLMINSQNRPITTNCFASGSMLNCTSQ